MPTYQYACTACGERLEAVQSFTDAPLTACPACSGALRKVFSAVGVVFKGSGFYKNDSRPVAKSGSSESKSSGDASTSSAPAASTAGEGSGTKPAPAAASSSSSSSSSPAPVSKTA